MASNVHNGAVLGESTARPDPLWLGAGAGGGTVAATTFKRAPWWTLDWMWRVTLKIALLVVLTGVVTS